MECLGVLGILVAIMGLLEVLARLLAYYNDPLHGKRFVKKNGKWSVLKWWQYRGKVKVG